MKLGGHNKMKGILALSHSAALAAVLAVGVTGGAAMAEKGGNKQGPQPSLFATTVCAVDGTNLNVTVRLTDITSGDAELVVGASTFLGVVKTKGNWDRQQPFDLANGVFDPADFEIDATLDLCRLNELEAGDVMSLDAMKAVNVESTINYNKVGGDVNDLKSINNRCADDPNTLETEAAGIRLTDEILDAVRSCF
jgi:hypothetical protein